MIERFKASPEEIKNQKEVLYYEPSKLKNSLIRKEQNKVDEVLKIQGQLKVSEAVIDELSDYHDYKG